MLSWHVDATTPAGASRTARRRWTAGRRQLLDVATGRARRALCGDARGAQDDDPEIAAWARNAAAGAGTTARDGRGRRAGRGGVPRRRLRDADRLRGRPRAGAPDVDRPHVPHAPEGSRSWLVLRALRELGVRAELVVAENDPFSADPDFPAALRAVLAPARRRARPGTERRDGPWIDADVPGPPLPAGRISPSCAARSAPHGRLVTPLPRCRRRTSATRSTCASPSRRAATRRAPSRSSSAAATRRSSPRRLLRVVGDERQRRCGASCSRWSPSPTSTTCRSRRARGAGRSPSARTSRSSRTRRPRGGQGRRRPLAPARARAAPRSLPARLRRDARRDLRGAGKRQSALAVSHAVQYHVHRRVELPKSAKVVALPGPLDVKTPHLDATRKSHGRGQRGRRRLRARRPDGDDRPGEYDAFAATSTGPTTPSSRPHESRPSPDPTEVR